MARRSWPDKLLDLVYPPRCVLCRRLLDRAGDGICPHCLSQLPRTAGGEVCQQGEWFDACYSPLFYAGPLRESFCRYKFEGLACYAPVFGRWMSRCLAEEMGQVPQVVTWVPLNRFRRWQRGYDQAALLAREVAGAWGWPMEALLEKDKRNRAQSSLQQPLARRANVRGAFRLRPGAQVEGRGILLVDDVITTGATLSECARVLKGAGADWVRCVTLARGVPLELREDGQKKFEIPVENACGKQYNEKTELSGCEAGTAGDFLE